jgi:hypothetical protein
MSNLLGEPSSKAAKFFRENQLNDICPNLFKVFEVSPR